MMSRGRRRLYLVLGGFFTTLGIVGIVTPVLPTTVFLIVASALFVEASPAAHAWLGSNRVTGPYLRAYREKAGLSRPRAAATIATLWIALAISAYFVRNHPWLLALLGAVGIGVTIHVIAVGRGARRRAAAEEAGGIDATTAPRPRRIGEAPASEANAAAPTAAALSRRSGGAASTDDEPAASTVSPGPRQTGGATTTEGKGDGADDGSDRRVAG